MKDNEVKTMLVMLLVALLAVPAVLSAAEFTQTLVEFNINANLAYVVTLAGQAWSANITSDPTAASAATTMIYFNTSSGADKAVMAQVAGGTIQSTGVPIMQFDNVGTQNVTLTVYLNDTTPACISLLGKTAFDAGAAGSTVIGVTNVTVASNFGPFSEVQPYYLYANFTNCSAGQTYRKLFSSGYT